MTKIIDSRFVNDMNQSYRPLTKTEELDCIIKAQAGNMIARNKLVNSQLRRIASIARGYASQNTRNDVGDLVSEGTIGLLEAIDRFDVTSGLRFYSYAQWWIRAQITYKVYDNQPLTVPRSKSKAKAEQKDLDGKVIRERIEALKLDTVSINAPVGDDDQSATYESIIPDDGIATDRLAEITNILDKIETLEEREREMIECRIYDELSYEDIGQMFGIKTREGVRQTINKIMVKLRKACRVHVTAE